nr:hypothetical protein [Tanacetum cinerariifolium]GEW80839.1 hypothetical protein [Tanacetum cinerariifolium]
MTAFNGDKLSVITTKLDTPLMLDLYTSDMCMHSWGRPSYARAMIELRADVELKDTIMVAMPKLNGASTSGKKKQAEVFRQEVSNSNPFDALNSIENDDDLGINGGISQSVGKGSLNVAYGNVDSESEVEVVFDKTANLMASTSFKGDSERSYGTNSLLKQWRLTKRDDDYDPYDDDLYENHDMFDHLQAICDDLDITVRDRKKKYIIFDS